MTGFNRNTAHKKYGKLKHSIGSIILLLNIIFYGLCGMGIVIMLFALFSDEIAKIMQWQYHTGFGNWEMFLHVFGFCQICVGLIGIGCMNVVMKGEKK